MEGAIDYAIYTCIENGIMRVYLENESAEVKRMLSMEWNDEVYREVLLEEGRDEGAARATEENARGMKEEGIASDIIARVTGLTEEEIARL